MNALTVLGTNLSDVPYGYCKCGCGQKTNIAPKTDRSCGWVKGEPLKLIRNHRPQIWSNRSGSPTYLSWQAMLTRTRPDNKKAKWYSDKGVVVCERWKNFDRFVEDMGERPDGTTLDRIDNDKGYEPGNCRWATKIQQMSNMSTNRLIEFNGERLTLAEWERRTGIKQHTIRYRIEQGWTPEEALTSPVGRFAR